MTIIQAFTGALGGTFADQWKDIITAGHFDEHTAVAPGVLKQTNNGRGTNYSGSMGVISNGSKIFVPENTAAFIFSQAGIEDIITQAGGYEYQNGQSSVFNGDGVKESLVEQVATPRRLRRTDLRSEADRLREPPGDTWNQVRHSWPAGLQRPLLRGGPGDHCVRHLLATDRQRGNLHQELRACQRFPLQLQHAGGPAAARAPSSSSPSPWR